MERSNDSLRKFKRYPEYRDSGVEWLGEIPAHWEVKRLRFLNLVNPSKTEVSTLPKDTNVSFIPMENIGDLGQLNLSQARSIGSVADGYTYFRDGDLLLAKITPCFENGKGALARNLDNGIGFGTTELYILRHKSNIHPNFQYYLTVSSPFRRIGEFEMKGAAGQKRVPEDFIRNFNLALPTIVEQEAIATFLDRETARIDALIAKKERLIELLQEKRTALITHAVTKGLDPDVPMKASGVEWLGEIPLHWDIVSLKYCTLPKGDAIKTGPFGSQLLSSDMVGGSIKVYNQRNVLNKDLSAGDNYITESKYEDLKAFTVFPGDILLTTRGTIGRCAILPADAELGILHPCLMRIQVRESLLSRDFLSLLIQESTVLNAGLMLSSNATTIDVIYSDTIKCVRIPIPPMDEQRQLVDFAIDKTSQIDNLINKAREAADYLKEYRTALISAAVTGKIDVRDQV